VAVHICKSSTWEAETEGFQVQGQSGLYRETLSEKEKQNLKIFSHNQKAKNECAVYFCISSHWFCHHISYKIFGFSKSFRI
jgi:hypothetical protein